MSEAKSLETYLNDHLAGATAALDLVDDVVEGADDEELRGFLAELREEITSDRRELEAVMERLGASQQRVKQLLADATESMSRLKLAGAGASEELSRLLELESLSAGIWMKKRMWRALAAAPVAEVLDGVDLEELAARADRQLDAVERRRLELAAQALHA